MFLENKEKQIPPTILTIFGATGDLAADYLIPTLFHMDMEKLLPADFKLVVVGRRELTAKSYLDFILKKSSVLKNVAPKQRISILKKLIYYKGDFQNPESFNGLSKILSDVELPKHKCFNRLYYFATSPQQFADITHILKSNNLLRACSSHERQVRVLVEKPFGFNLKSARSLNQLLLKFFKEEQVYRIDHYQGKETVQNLLVARFANGIFEPLWNKDHIDHIEVTVMEKDTVESRAAYYDQYGALKDMLQNHLLQMLSLLTMEEPANLTPKDIRDQKYKILKALSLPKENFIIKGQYEKYRRHAGRESNTESFVALKVFINTSRWQGVPIYLKTGKAMSKKLAEISVHFKEPARCMFRHCAANVLTFRIQPNESVRLQINNKIPGFGVDIHQSNLEFAFEDLKLHTPSAYERLLLDFMQGDQRLFIRSDEIETAWKFVDKVVESREFTKSPAYKYKIGSDGPKEAEEWMQKEGKEWWTK